MQPQRLKVLLPVYDNGKDTYDRVFREIRKAGCDFSMLVDWDHYELGASGTGELPARNRLWKLALEQDDWNYCVTLSNDIYELPEKWGLKFIVAMGKLEDQGRKVGALNAYGFVNVKGYNVPEWWQFEINALGNNTGHIYTPETLFGPNEPTPPNPELSTACCMMTRECLEQVGLFDTGFGRGGGMEHWDYVIRMYHKGFENLLTYDVRFKADIDRGNNFGPSNTYDYYRRKWGTGLDGLPTSVFIEKAKYTSPSAGFTI